MNTVVDVIFPGGGEANIVEKQFRGGKNFQKHKVKWLYNN